MSMIGSDFLKTAATLVVDEKSEANLRSAASRAYYAVFHESMEAIPDDHAPTGSQLKSSSSHECVIQGLLAWGKSLTPGREYARLAGRDLARLKKIRHVADYQLSDTFNLLMAEEAIAVARQTIGNLNAAKSRYATSGTTN